MNILLVILLCTCPALAQDDPSSDPEPSDPEPSGEWTVEPAEPAAAAEPTDASGPPDAADPPDSGITMFGGLHLGPAFSFSPLRTAVLPRLGVGFVLPVNDLQVGAFLTASYARPSAEGTASDARLPASDGDWSWSLKQSEWQIAFGPTLRLAGLDMPVVPEVSVGPSIYVLSSVFDGKSGGTAFPQSRERYVAVGVYYAMGAAAEVGPGWATFHLQITGAGLKDTAGPNDPKRTTVTGKSTTAAIAPTLGYRLEF